MQNVEKVIKSKNLKKFQKSFFFEKFKSFENIFCQKKIEKNNKCYPLSFPVLGVRNVTRVGGGIIGQ